MSRDDEPVHVSKTTFWLGVGVMCFYVLDCVFQNELFQRLERGSNCSNQTGETTGLLLPAAGTSLARLYQPRSSTPGLLGQYDDAVSTSDSWGPLTTHHANSSKCHTKFDRPFFIVWWCVEQQEKRFF